MSRIHEALQRAYLERGKVPAARDIQVVEPPTNSVEEEEPQAARVELDLDHIAQHRWHPELASFPTLDDRGAGVEQFRSLRSHVYQARYESPLKTILIASGMPSEGKSFIAANLAMSLARNSIHNILLIDGDLRRPTLHNLLGAPNKIGLANFLEGNADMMEIMQRDESREGASDGSADSITNLTFISSGKCNDNSSELVANHRIEELVSTVSPYFDWIVIDAPPVLAVTDAVELARAADAVLLVARGSSTPYEVAQRAKAAFSSSRVLGFVLNDVKDVPQRGAYNYNYNYYSGDQEGGAPSRRYKESGSKK
jgi:protein-tyrosine kinase